MAHRAGVDLLAVVGLEGEDGKSELCVHIAEEGADDIMNIRFLPNREHPNVMSICIKQNNIVFEPRMTRNRRRPDIQMNKLKRKINLSFRGMKGEPNIFP